jgi:hypothetical protein
MPETRLERILFAAGVAAIITLVFVDVNSWGGSDPAAYVLSPVATVAPLRVVAGAAAPLTFTFRAGANGIRDGRVAVSVPAGWALPSRSSTSAGHVTSSAGVLAVRGDSIAVRDISLPAGSSFTVTYGGGSIGATQPEAVGRYEFPVFTAVTASAPLRGLPRSPQVTVKPPSFVCQTTVDPSGLGQQLALPSGVARPNLHNTQTSTGSIAQCHKAVGLTTSIALSSISSSGAGPAGFPEAAYGYSLYDQPFCTVCRSNPFPLPVAQLDRSYWLGVAYALGSPSPSSLPRDFIYDLWLERDPVSGLPPRSGDLELIVFLYEQGMGGCLSYPAPVSFSTNISFRGREVPSRWEVCQIHGGTDATPVAFFLKSPAPRPAASVALQLRDFVDEAGAFLATDVGGDHLMGVEVGTEFDQCSPPAGCVASTVSWRWQVSHLALESASGTIPIAFAVARQGRTRTRAR